MFISMETPTVSNSTARPPSGCRFHPRCPIAIDACRLDVPPFVEVAPAHRAACWRADEPDPLRVHGAQRALMRLLDRYLLREFATPFCYCFFGFYVFWVSFDLLAQS